MDLVEARKKARLQKGKPESGSKDQTPEVTKTEAQARAPEKKEPKKHPKPAAEKKVVQPQEKPASKQEAAPWVETPAQLPREPEPPAPPPEPKTPASEEDIFVDMNFGEDLPSTGAPEEELVLAYKKPEPPSTPKAKAQPSKESTLSEGIAHEVMAAADADARKNGKASAPVAPSKPAAKPTAKPAQSADEEEKEFFDLVVEDLIQYGYGQTATEANLTELLSFRLGKEVYAVPLIRIQQIIKPRPVTIVPGAPSYILGIISLRGMIIPIFDLRRRLGLELAAPSRTSRIIIIKLENDIIAGILVDQVMEVARVPADSIEPTPAIFSGIEGEFLEGIARHKTQMMIVLNLSQVILELKENGATNSHG